MIFTVLLLSPCLLVSSASVSLGSLNAPVNSTNSTIPTARRERQVSPSEWLFSTIVQPQSGSEKDVRYRSIQPSPPSNYYTNYYRNHNIYSSKQEQQPQGRRIDNGDDKHYEDKQEGLDRRRASPLQRDEVRAAATSKVPEAISPPGLSRTAPATDPTDRATSTQEMSDDDLLLGNRAEMGRRTGKARATESIYFKEGDTAPIIFPGSSTTSTRAFQRTGQGGRNTFSGGGREGSTNSGPSWPAITLNPSDKRHIDGWNKLHELRQKSKNMQDGKKSLASDSSADAKIIAILNIENTPHCAQRNGYCEEIDGYPKTFFNQVLNKSLNLAPDVFQDIFGETTDNNSVFTDVEYSLRDGFDETPLCSVREHTIYPKAAQNRRGKYMYIVNHDEYLQGIRVETCTREKDSCMFTEGHLPGYSSTCKQKYIYKKLLAFSPDGKAMPDTFRLPSCCVCYVRNMFISDRINPVVDLGGQQSTDTQPTASDDHWSPSTSTITYQYHDDSGGSSTEPESITFPSTGEDFQVPIPTTSTQKSSKVEEKGQQRANQTTSRRL